MTKIDIFSGFLGAGKTTLIKKLINEAYKGEKLVLIENEFGEIGIDGGFLKDSGIEITEMNSGCICCSLVGDFGEALKKVLKEYAPDRIIIEPSGVGKLSDVIRAVQNIHSDEIVLDGFTTVADANKCKVYMKNFGEFFNDQIEHAGTIILSHTKGIKQDKLDTAVSMIREHNPNAVIITTDWDELDGKQMLEAIERKDTLEAELELLKKESECDDDDDDCCCHHDYGHEHEHHHEHENEHYHDHDHDDHDNEHHHHDDDDDECCCHHDHDHDEHDHDHEHEHHHHHHHHHADDVFTSWGRETARKFTADEIEGCLKALEDEKYGTILRAKGIVPAEDGTWIHFDYVPGEPDVRTGSSAIIGRLCVIGSKIDEKAIAELFNV